LECLEVRREGFGLWERKEWVGYWLGKNLGGGLLDGVWGMGEETLTGRDKDDPRVGGASVGDLADE
jgi:hypothetical protein